MPDHRSLNLTPGESLYLKDPYSTHSSDHIKVTFADLLLKKAIKAEMKKEKIFFWTRKEIKVSRGESFSKIDFKIHERFILDHITSYPKKLGDVARDLHATLKTSQRFCDLFLRDPLTKKGYLRVEDDSYSSKYVLTVKGLDAHDRIECLLYQAKNMKQWAAEDPARAKAYILVCGANILLLSPERLEIIKRLGKELEYVQSNANSYYDYYWYDYTWRHHLFEDLELGRDFDLDFIDFSLPEFDVLDSFDSIGSSLDGGFGGDGGDGGGDGGGGGD
jgi:hypothetical protein